MPFYCGLKNVFINVNIKFLRFDGGCSFIARLRAGPVRIFIFPGLSVFKLIFLGAEGLYSFFVYGCGLFFRQPEIFIVLQEAGFCQNFRQAAFFAAG